MLVAKDAKHFCAPVLILQNSGIALWDYIYNTLHSAKQQD